MKISVKYLLVLGFLGLIVSCAGVARNNDDKGTAEAKEILEKFYKAYITDCDSSSGIEGAVKLRDKYCTKSYVNEINNDEFLEADPILQAQDCFLEWVNTLSVNETKKPGQFRVCMFYAYENKDRCLIVQMKEEEGTWKVDEVRLAE